LPIRPTAIVIGAGIGGIAAAGRLARHGFEVTVVEKDDAPGGRCSRLLRDGRRFDIGPTLFLMPGVFAQTYAALGAAMAEQLDLRRVDPTYRIRFEDGTDLTLTGDLNEMQRQLEAIEPGAFGGLLCYLAEGHRHYHVSPERFVGRNFRNILEYFSPANVPLLFQLKALTKHYANIGRYFGDPRLKAAFTFQNMYLGPSPFDAPATYSLLQYTEQADGVWFPMGGMYRVVETLAALAERNGVRFCYSAPVAHILVNGGRAEGVLLEDGRTLTADVIVANADLPYVYRSLLPYGAEARRLEGLKYTCSAIMFYWGVDKIYPQLGHHNIFRSGDYRASFDRIFRDNTLPDSPSFYVHAPARIDPAAAPAGQDTLMALVPAGHIDEAAPQDWDDLSRRARLAGVGAAELEAHLKFEIQYTPLDWKAGFNLARGAAFGLSHNFAQVGYLRPQNRHRRYRNLCFVGASTYPGTGLPIVLLSAGLTAERILQELPPPRRQALIKASGLEAGASGEAARDAVGAAARTSREQDDRVRLQE
jgi:phytoene desaturase